MKEWKEVKLGDIADIIGGGTPSTKNDNYWEGDIPWLTPKDLRGFSGRYISGGERYITNEGYNNSSAQMLPKNSVLMSSRAPIGYLAIAAVDVCTNQGFKSFVIKDSLVYNLFLYYWLKSKTDYLQQLGTGTTFAEISGKVVKSIQILLPPLKEQKAIAEVLSNLDDKIELLQKQNETLEQLAETLFRQWFIEEAEEDWEEIRIKDVADVKIGRTPPRKEHQWFSSNNKDIKWISIKDMGNSDAYILDTAECLTKEAVEQFNIPIIPPYTVILSFKMTVGRVNITTEHMTSNEAIAQFMIKNRKISNLYLYLFLKLFKYEVLGSTSSIVTAINSKMIKSILINIPPQSLLDNFMNIVSPYFDKIESNQLQIQTLTEMRDTLLPKLMSGEVRVKLAD